MRALKLRIISAQQTVQTIVINNKFSLAVEQGASYSLIDAETNKFVTDIILKKQADSLLVELANGVTVELKQFYSETSQATFDVGVATKEGASSLITSDSQPVENSNIVWQLHDDSVESDGFTSSEWMYMGLGGLAGIAVAAGIGVGVSGSSSSASNADTEVMTNTNNIVQGLVVAGPVLEANELTVLVYKADGKTLLGEVDVTADGSFSINVGDYTGVVIAKVKDNGSGADYLDEATGIGKDLNAELFSVGVIVDANSKTDLNINVLTTIAYQKAIEQAGNGSLNTGIVIDTNIAIAEAFGLDSLQTTGVITTNGESGYNALDGLTEGETYGAVLAALSGADKNNQGETQTVIDKIAAGITVTGTGAVLNTAAQQEIILGAANVNVDIQTILATAAFRITSSATANAINENSGAAQVIYMATVQSNSNVGYSLKENAGDSNLFSINSNTGAVTLTTDADYETKESYSFTVVATDAENNFQERTVSLAINNIDEMAPVITSSNVAQAIEDKSGSGQIIYKVTSTDTLDISTGTTKYELKAGDDANLFSINNVTGEVVLTANPEHEVKDNYHFTVVATDAANNSSEQAVTLPISENSEIERTAVVFDLLRGVSSNHSEREFDSSVSYNIYIQVDSERQTLNTSNEEPASWGVWHAWDKLSSDDHIIFVGSGGVILGEENLPITRYSQDDSYYYLRTVTFTAITFNANGNITRIVDDFKSSAILGDNVRVSHSINQLPVVNLSEILTQRPDAIWSSQGLL